MIDQEDIRNMIRERGINIWQKRWNNTPACGQTKIWFPKLDMETTPFFRSLTRKELGRAIQLLTSHNDLGRHQAKVKKPGLAIDCGLCGEEEEVAAHLWERCQVMTIMGWVTPTLIPEKPRVVIMGERTVTCTTALLKVFLNLPLIERLLKPDKGDL